MVQTIEEKRRKWREYGRKHQKERTEYMKIYREKNKEKLLKYAQERYDENRDGQIKYSTEWRENNRERYNKNNNNYYYNNKNKVFASLAAQQHVKLKDKCEICESNINLERHHPDYTKPLEVVTLCSGCHGLEHRKLRRKK